MNAPQTQGKPWAKLDRLVDCMTGPAEHLWARLLNENLSSSSDTSLVSGDTWKDPTAKSMRKVMNRLRNHRLVYAADLVIAAEDADLKLPHGAYDFFDTEGFTEQLSDNANVVYNWLHLRGAEKAAIEKRLEWTPKINTADFVATAYGLRLIPQEVFNTPEPRFYEKFLPVTANRVHGTRGRALIQGMAYALTTGDDDSVVTFKKAEKLYESHVKYCVDTCKPLFLIDRVLTHGIMQSGQGTV